jgi:hypothetical protein
MSQPEDPPAREPAPRWSPPPVEPPRRGWSYSYRWGQDPRQRSGRGCLWVPIALIVIGVIALLAQLGLLSWVRWAIVWPLLAIVLGVALILRRRR